MNIFPRSAQFELVSTLPLDEVRMRIKSRLGSLSITKLRQEMFIGEIKDHRVRVARYRPGTRRALSPQFVGSLVLENTTVVLRGHFEMNFFEKTSVILFLAGSLFALIREIVFLAHGHSTDLTIWKIVLFALLPFVCIYVIQRGWKIRQDDVSAITVMLNDLFAGQGISSGISE